MQRRRFAAILALMLLTGFMALPGLTRVARASTPDVCSSGCTYTGIQAALDAAVDGDTIQIAAGTYTGGITIGKSITLAGSGAASTTISGGRIVVTVFGYRNVSISGVTISGGTNTSADYTDGAGILNSGNLTLTRVVVANNSTSNGEGAGIMNYGGGTLTVRESTVRDNSAVFGGGGIYNYGTAVVVNSTISGNHATNLSSNGGGIFNSSSSVTVINSTISGNAANDGAGLFGGATLVNSTISGNRTGTYGFGPGVGGGSYALSNTILAGNSGGANTRGRDCWGATLVDGGGGHNIIGDPEGDGSGMCPSPTNGVNGNQVGTHANPIAPKLASLANNGGPTSTMKPLSDSPAIGKGDAATCVSSQVNDQDQRVYERQTATRGNTCDVGAYDTGGDLPAPTAPTVRLSTDSDTGTSSSDNITKDATPTFVGTADPTARVSVYDGANTTPVCTATADASGSWSCASSTLSDGAHTITAKVGSVSSAALSVTIDTVAPTITLDPIPAYVNSPNPLTFSGTAGIATGDSASVVVTFYSGSSVAASNLIATLNAARDSSTGAYSSTLADRSPDGVYTVQATQTDTVGNSSITSARTFTIDTTGPSINITAKPDKLALSTSADFAFSATDGAGSPTLQCKLDGGSFGNCTSNTTMSYTSLAVGEHTFTVQATDPVGNSTTIGYTWRVDTAPTLNAVTYPSTPPWGKPVSFTASASDPDTVAPYNDTLAYSLQGAPAGATINASTGAFTWTPTASQISSTAYNFKVVVTDSLGRSADQTISITVSKLVPKLICSGASATQYSDAVTLRATLADADGAPISGATINFTVGAQSASASTGTDGVATTSLVLTQPAAVTTVSTSFSGNDLYAATSASSSFTITKEQAGAEYTGDLYLLTAGPTISTAPVRLAAHLTQQADGYPGDITKATVSFELYKATNISSAPDQLIGNVPVDASGNALTSTSLATDNWTVKVKIDAGNRYWTAAPVGESVVTVAVGSTDKRVTGGGWIADGGSKGNFGFTVTYQKTGSPKGNAVYLFRSADGYNYLVKTTSWQGGGLSFTADPSKASFTGKAVVQQIDRATGEIVASWGNYTVTVDLVDGDTLSPRQGDQYAITVLDTAGKVWHQMGTRTSLVPLGGGNVSVQSK